MLDVNELSAALINIWDVLVIKGAAVTSKGLAGDVLFVELMKAISQGSADLAAEKALMV